MKVKLLGIKELKDFPSGSAIEYFDEKVYLAGDDAKEVLVMNKRWKELSRIPLFISEDERLAKAIKPDLEASTLIEVNKIPRLLLLGSGSEAQFRNKAVLVNLDDNTHEEFDTKVFYNRIKEAGIQSLNIESAAIVLGEMIMSSRGNSSFPENYAIVTSHEFWKDEQRAPLSVLRFELPEKPKKFIGVSGMTYSSLNDWLILTFSTEETPNAMDDGPIGDSYLGIAENAASKMTRKKIKVNHLINLAEADEKFKGHKIESVCIQSEKSDQLKIQMVADNDKGVSYLFKARVKI